MAVRWVVVVVAFVVVEAGVVLLAITHKTADSSWGEQEDVSRAHCTRARAQCLTYRVRDHVFVAAGKGRADALPDVRSD